MQATSDKTASANFTQTGETVNEGDMADNVTYGKDGYNPYYQFGRKDAFRSKEYTTSPASGTSLIYSNTNVTVGTTIQNPTTHYHYGNNSYDPCYYNAWNATYTECAGESTAKVDGLEKTVKTVYDPCPVGYTVPPANTFTKFSTSNCTVSGKGRQYTENGKTLYFPYTGTRAHTSASIMNAGSAYYWSDVFGSSPHGRDFRFDSSSVTSIFGNGGTMLARSYAKSIRPVREN